MSVDDFWTWIWELNTARLGGKPNTRDLSRCAGLNQYHLYQQSRQRRWPTINQGKAIARVLQVSFEELQRHANLRPDNKAAKIHACLSCALPDCDEGDSRCQVSR